MNPSHRQLAAIAVTPFTEAAEPRRRPAARRFMSKVDVGLTALLVLGGATVVASLVIFLGALMVIGAIEAGQWVLSAGWGPVVHVKSLLEFSAVGGLLLAVMGCAVFASDLRRQRWL